MLNWQPVELHTHSNHSDGGFEVEELVEEIGKLGFKALALTDHNAISGQRQLREACKEHGIVAVRGTEWTTYYGHMLVLGEEGCTDWRPYHAKNLHLGIEKIHKNHGMVGIAHPFALSEPLSTGYHWAFELEDYSCIDYIEVWSREFPANTILTKKAFVMWDELLEKGYRVSGTSGRDWHRLDPEPRNYGYIHLGIEGELSERSVLDAFRKGRSYVTLGPKLVVSMDGVAPIEIGDEIKSQKVEFEISVDDTSDFEEYKKFDIVPESIRIYHNGEVVYECDIEGKNEFQVQIQKGYFRIEVVGTYQGCKGTRIAFTNPVYVV